MLFFPEVQGFVYERSDPFFDENGEPTIKCQHFTVLFHTFILQTLCQMINARKVYERDFNVFEGMLSNWIYLGVLAGSFTVQMLFVAFGGQLIRCAPLSVEQHASCAVQALGVLVVAALVKFVPSRYFAWCRFEEEPREEEDAFDLSEFYMLKPSAHSKLLGHTADQGGSTKPLRANNGPLVYEAPTFEIESSTPGSPLSSDKDGSEMGASLAKD